MQMAFTYLWIKGLTFIQDFLVIRNPAGLFETDVRDYTVTEKKGMINLKFFPQISLNSLHLPKHEPASAVYLKVQHQVFLGEPSLLVVLQFTAKV